MKNSLTVYVDNETQLTRLKALMLSLDLSFVENELSNEHPEELVDNKNEG